MARSAGTDRSAGNQVWYAGSGRRAPVRPLSGRPTVQRPVPNAVPPRTMLSESAAWTASTASSGDGTGPLAFKSQATTKGCC